MCVVVVEVSVIHVLDGWLGKGWLLTLGQAVDSCNGNVRLLHIA